MIGRGLIRWALRIVAILLLVAGVAGTIGMRSLRTPFQGFTGETMLTIPRGSSTRAIAHQLAAAGVIENEWTFLMQRAISPGAKLQAGQYEFKQAASVQEIFERLRRGDIYTFEFTVPEGSNIWDIARLLESKGILKEQDFLKAASDPTLIRDLDPEAESLEGYLFPSTYRLSPNSTAADLCRMMVAEFRRQWKKINGEGAASVVHRAVTLASLVEKETGSAGERGLVAGVFSNRLRMGMALACDPTVVYAALLLGKYRGTIYQSDLDREHPYNTYKNSGLPPGPIANPGAATLEAALRPAQTDYLFFVAKPEGGGHIFSATGAAHARAVQNYRNAMHAQDAKNAGKAN